MRWCDEYIFVVNSHFWKMIFRSETGHDLTQCVQQDCGPLLFFACLPGLHFVSARRVHDALVLQTYSLLRTYHDDGRNERRGCQRNPSRFFFVFVCSFAGYFFIQIFKFHIGRLYSRFKNCLYNVPYCKGRLPDPLKLNMKKMKSDEKASPSFYSGRFSVMKHARIIIIICIDVMIVFIICEGVKKD